MRWELRASFPLSAHPSHEDYRGQPRRPKGGCYEAGRYPLFVVYSKSKKPATLPVPINSTELMADKQTKKTFHLNAVIAGRLISGFVSFSPAPQPGILTEVARLDAERILEDMVREKIAAGRL